MAKILVTGGCGYIGSHTLVDLINHGFNVVSIDNLSNSDDSVLDAIYKITGKKVKNYPVDLSDQNALLEVFEKEKNIAGIIHFAALKAVGESVEKPLKYYANNLGGLINLLNSMNQFAIHPLIFSSSCSVYGNAEALPVTENTPWQPAESPYARTKQMGEEIINDTLVAHPNLKAIFLRYFNPAGAHESALMGESPINEANNLVPVITETAIGKRSSMTVFGTDYPTRDGSCIRDYIHIMDLANAHTKALQYLLNPNHDKRKIAFNLGIGEGVTVLEAIRAFEKISGQNLNYVLGERRPGDVVAIYANNKQAASILGWQPTRNIDEIMSSAWKWEKART
ncbi:MAG: UDP-glucose 4-epimerase GalE [Saprospiraceae bacterium]